MWSTNSVVPGTHPSCSALALPPHPARAQAVFGAEFQCDDLDTAVQMRRHIQGCSELRNAACLAFTVWLTPEREVGCRCVAWCL